MPDNTIGLVNPTQSASGETIEADDINTPVNQLATVINGSIETANLADGSVTGSKLASHNYCFRAYASGSTTLTDDTVVTIALATEEYDYNSNFAANTYTAPVAGVYHFDAAFNISGSVATGVYAFAAIYKNGAEAIRGQTAVPTASDTFTVSGDILLAANDTILLKGYQNSAGNEATTTGSPYTYLSGHIVRAS